MTGPLVDPRGRLLLPEYRWLNAVRLFVMGLFLAFLLFVVVALLIGGPSVGLAVVIWVLVLVALPTVIWGTFYRWSLLRRAGVAWAATRPEGRFLLFSRLSYLPSASGRDSIVGPGWLLIDARRISVWEVGSWFAPRAQAVCIADIPLERVDDVRRHDIARGWAYARLLVSTADGARVDVALVDARGRSAFGVADVVLDQAAELIRAAKTDQSTR